MSSNYPVNQAFYAVGAPVQQHYRQVAMIRGMPNQMWQSPGPTAHHRSAIGSTATYCRPQLVHAYSKAPPPPSSFSYYPLNPRPQFQFQHPPPPQTAAAWSVTAATSASYAYGGNSGMSQQRGQFPQYAVRGRRPGTVTGGSASNGNGHGAMHAHAPVPGSGGYSTWKAEDQRRPGSPEFDSSESSESSGVNDLDRRRKKRKSAHTSKDMDSNRPLYSELEDASSSQSQRYSSQTSPTLPPPPPSALIVHTPRYQPFSPAPRVPPNPTKIAATTNIHNNHWMLRSRSPTPKLSPTIPPLKRRKLEHPQPHAHLHSQPHPQPHPHPYSVEPPPYQLHEQGSSPAQPTLSMPYNHHLMPPPSSFPRYPPPPRPPLPSRSVGRLVPVRNEDWPTSAPAQVPPPTSTSALQLPPPPSTPAGAGGEVGSVPRSGMSVSMSLPSPSTFELPPPAPDPPWLHPSQPPSVPHHVPVRAGPAHASAAGIYGGVRVKQEEDYTNVSFSSLSPVKTEEVPSTLYFVKKEEPVSPSVSRHALEPAPAPVPVSTKSAPGPNFAPASTFSPIEVDTETDPNDTNPTSASVPNSQPRPASSRKLITSASAYYPYPPTCLQSHMDHKANRKVFFKEKMRELVRKGLKRRKAYSRDDGLVIEWTSSVPVWSDTLLPDLPDLATAIQLAYSLNRGLQGSSTSGGRGTPSATRGRRKGGSALASASNLTPASGSGANSQGGAGGYSTFKVKLSSTASASTSTSKLSATRTIVDLNKSENEKEEETHLSPAEDWELYSGTQHGSQSQSQSQLRSKSKSRSKAKSKSKTPASFKPTSGFYIDVNIDNNNGGANASASHDYSSSHARQFTTTITSDLKRKIKDMDRGMGIVQSPLSTPPTPEAAGVERAGAGAEQEGKAMPTPMPTPTAKALPGRGTAQRSTHMPTPSFSSAGSLTPTSTPTLASSATPGLTPDLQSTSQPNLNSNSNVKPRPRPLPLPGRKRLPLPGRAHLQSQPWPQSQPQSQSQSQVQKVLATPNPTPSPTRVTPAQTQPTQHHQAQSQSQSHSQAQVLLPVAFSPRQSRFTTPTLQQSQQQSSLSLLALANVHQHQQEESSLVSPPKTAGSVGGSASPAHPASGSGDAAEAVGTAALNGAGTGADSASLGSSANEVGVQRSTTPASSSSKTSILLPTLPVEAPSGIGAADLGTGSGESESVNVNGAAARRSATPGSVSSSATLVPPPATASPLQPAVESTATATPWSSSLSPFGTALASAVSRYPDPVSQPNPSPSTGAEADAGGPLPAPSLSEVTVKEEAVDDLEGPELKDHTEKRTLTPPSAPAQIDFSRLSGQKDMDVDNESDGTEIEIKDDAAVASDLLLSCLERPTSAGSAHEDVHPGGTDANLGVDADTDMPMDMDVAMDVSVDAEVDEDDGDGSVSTDGGEVVALVTEFLQRYCQLFDTDRAKLEMAYAPNALFSCRRHDLGDSQFPKPGLSTPPASPSIPIVTQGRTQIVNELLGMGPYVFCPRGKARNLHFDAVVVDAPSSLPLSTSTTASNIKNPGLGDILLTVHGEVVLPHVEDPEKDHILAFDQSFLLRKPEAVGMSMDASNGTLSAGAHTEKESGTADDGDSDDSQVDGTGQSVKQGWPLLAISHQMTVRAELLLDAEKLEEELPWVKEILE